MAEYMTALLNAADGPLAFIVIIPAWRETEVCGLMHQVTLLLVRLTHETSVRRDGKD